MQRSRLASFLAALAFVVGAAPSFAQTPSGSPFAFPTNPAGRTTHYGNYQTTRTSKPDTLFYAATGTSGVVRSWSIIPGGGHPERQYLKVYYDGSSTPSVVVPFVSLAGADSLSFLYSDSVKTANTRFFDMPQPIAPSGSASACWTFRYPIPFTNGLLMTLTPITAADSQTVWSNVTAESPLPACWNRNYRFGAVRTSGLAPKDSLKSSSNYSVTGRNVTIVGAGFKINSSYIGKTLSQTSTPEQDLLITAIVDTLHATIAASEARFVTTQGQTQNTKINTPAVIFSRSTSKPGFLAALNVAFVPTSNTHDIFLESNYRFTLDGEAEPSYNWTGTEDYALCAFYAESFPKGQEGGVMAMDLTDTAGSSAWYRQFWTDPVAWQRSASVAWFNVDSSTVRWAATAIFYERVN